MLQDVCTPTVKRVLQRWCQSGWHCWFLQDCSWQLMTEKWPLHRKRQCLKKTKFKGTCYMWEAVLKNCAALGIGVTEQNRIKCSLSWVWVLQRAFAKVWELISWKYRALGRGNLVFLAAAEFEPWDQIELIGSENVLNYFYSAEVCNSVVRS